MINYCGLVTCIGQPGENLLEPSVFPYRIQGDVQPYIDYFDIFYDIGFFQHLNGLVGIAQCGIGPGHDIGNGDLYGNTLQLIEIDPGGFFVTGIVGRPEKSFYEMGGGVEINEFFILSTCGFVLLSLELYKYPGIKPDGYNFLFWGVEIFSVLNQP